MARDVLSIFLDRVRENQRIYAPKRAPLFDLCALGSSNVHPTAMGRLGRRARPWIGTWRLSSSLYTGGIFLAHLRTLETKLARESYL
jgi:hypothetical protein